MNANQNGPNSLGDSDDVEEGDSLPIIIGAAAGGVVLCILCIAGVVCLSKKRKSESQPVSLQPSYEPMTGQYGSLSGDSNQPPADYVDLQIASPNSTPPASHYEPAPSQGSDYGPAPSFGTGELYSPAPAHSYNQYTS